jgi:hypothetical protein
LRADADFAPERIVGALNAAGVRYVIVGGLAVGAHGVVRATRDLNLVADPTSENMDLLAAVLERLGGEHPISGSLTGEGLARPVSFTIETSAGEVHVLNRMPGTPAFDDLDAERILVEIDSGVDAPICALRHLRQMKRASDRPRDAVDLAELDALHGPEPLN